MHPIEGADPVNVGGELRYKDTDPPTDLVASDTNAIMLSLFRLITAGGEALLVNGAADQADNWQQVLRAVRKVPLKLIADTVLIDGGLTSPTISQDKFLLQLIPDATDRPGAECSLDGNVTHDKRVIFVSNETASYKFVRGGDTGQLIRLEPQRAIALLGIVRSGATVWIPIDGQETEEKTISCKLFDSSNSSSAFDMTYMVDNRRGITHVRIPPVNFTPTGGGSSIDIKKADGSNLPAEISGRWGAGVAIGILRAFFGSLYICEVEEEGTGTAGAAVPRGTGFLRISTTSGTFANTAGTFYGGQLSFFNNKV